MPTTSTTSDPFAARVRARLDSEKIALEARVGQVTALRDTAITEVNQTLAGLTDASAKLTTAAAADKPLTDAKINAALDAATDQRAKLRAMVTHNATLVALRADLKRLGTKAEVDRRIKQAKEYDPGTDEPLTQRAAVELVLLRAGRPMHYQEITRVALETGLLRTAGETPEATVSAMLATRAKAGDTFVKVDPGIFNLLPIVEAAPVEEVAA